MTTPPPEELEKVKDIPIDSIQIIIREAALVLKGHAERMHSMADSEDWKSKTAALMTADHVKKLAWVHEMMTEFAKQLQQVEKERDELKFLLENANEHNSLIQQQLSQQSANIEKMVEALKPFQSGVDYLPWGRIKALLQDVQTAKRLTGFQVKVDEALSTAQKYLNQNSR